MTPEEEGSGLGTVALQTVGCKLNQAETDSLARKFLKAGYQVVAPDAPADIYLLNTCTVTSTADQKCRKLLRHARRRNPDALVVATGCYVERAPADILAIDGVSIAVGNDEKARLVEIVGDRAGVRGPVLCTAQPQPAPLRTRSLVKIQEGCSQWCSFCVVPRVRGPESSRPPEEVLSELKDRVAEGYKEIVLTGTRIGRYEHAGGLTGLVELILGETDVERVRLSSLEPADINPELLRLWQDRRLCRHIHLPLQSGSDPVLERMHRPYTAAGYERAVSLARQAIPDLAVTTDVMVAFPGESEAEFRESYDLCERMAFARMHVFPYSARPLTRAARMPDPVEAADRKRRTGLMLDLAQRSGERFRKLMRGKTLEVLWEGRKDGHWFGLTDNYVRVFLSDDAIQGNQLLATKLVALQRDGLRGELATPRPQFAGARGL